MLDRSLGAVGYRRCVLFIELTFVVVTNVVNHWYLLLLGPVFE
jgi:hypothetical protein